MEALPDKYTQKKLGDMHKNKRKEFDMIFQLASNKYWEEYIKEQSNHVKGN
ncbi:MAG: hypothetical protein P4L45_09620 [Ignavibacteriaceae bacterium]|nr:hypothetical protein [Ignavibacteriaceae bacterium]